MSKELLPLKSVKSSGANSLFGTSVKHVVTYFSRVSSGNLAYKYVHVTINYSMMTDDAHFSSAYLYSQLHSVGAIMMLSKLVQLFVQLVLAHVIAQCHQITPNKLGGRMTVAREAAEQLLSPVLVAR